MRAALIAALMAPSSVAEAQRAFGFGIGADIPIGGSADVLKSGYHTTASITFRAGILRRRVRIDGTITDLRRQDSLSTALRIQYFTFDVVASGPTRLTPTGYVVAGVGSYQQTAGGRRTSDAGLNIGAGINFPRAVVGSYIEARLHYIGGEARTKLFTATFGLVF